MGGQLLSEHLLEILELEVKGVCVGDSLLHERGVGVEPAKTERGDV